MGGYVLWIKAFHIIFIVTWFSGLFYLPRLFVYHAMSEDTISQERFKIMERKLYYGIVTPSAILATLSGILLLSQNWFAYLTAGWMQLKLGLVIILWVYQFICSGYMNQFKSNVNKHSHVFYRWFNEISAIILVVVVILVVLKP